MVTPKKPENEKKRLENLQSYHILDSISEADYDSITALAAQICNTEISLISLIDENRQWFKSACGLEAKETPRDYSFCAHAILNPNEILEVPDVKNDHRFADNPLVVEHPFIGFYAGVPLISEEGFPVGTLCVIDSKPSKLSESQTFALKHLGRQVIALMSLRKKKIELEHALHVKDDLNKQLENFALVAAHDIKAPLSNIIAVLDELKQNESLNERAAEDVHLINMSTTKLRTMVDRLLEYSRAASLPQDNIEAINLKRTIQNLKSTLLRKDGVKIEVFNSISNFTTNRTSLELILLNLLTNAIRYNDKEVTEIAVTAKELNDYYQISVADNGPGIPEDKFDDVFEVFSVNTSRDRFGVTGSGLGLATIKRILERIGGSIELSSKPNEGALFTFRVPIPKSK